MAIDKIINHIQSVNSEDNLSIDKLKEDLILIENNYITIRQQLKRYELSRFLYYACLAFNRFAIPTKYYIETDDFLFYGRYLLLLKRVEAEVNHYINTLSLDLDLIRWEIYELLKNNDNINIQLYNYKLKKIMEKSWYFKKGRYEEKEKEFKEKADNLKNLLLGIKTQTVFSKIKMSIPITPFMRESIIRTKFKGRNIQINFNPTFYNNNFSIDGAIPIKSSSSNWQNGITEVSVSITGFVDLLTIDSSLYVEIDSQENNAHYLHKYLYYLLTDVLWNLKVDDKLTISNWSIEPNDIENVTYEVISYEKSLEWKHFPIKNKIMFSGNFNYEPDNFILDITTKIEWHQKCLFLSKDYLSVGNSNLCIFWLNVGIESFLNTRISEICSINHLDSNYLKENYLDSIKAKLKEINSEEILSRINWPKSDFRFISMFKKIKKITRDNLIDCSQKELIRHYQTISKHRNKLFHGETDGLIDAVSAKRAIISFEWILNNFK